METPTRWCPGTETRTCPTKETLRAPQQERCPLCAFEQNKINVRRKGIERAKAWTQAASQVAIQEARQVEPDTYGVRGALKVFDVMLRIA